jgi:hypothetical protein
MNKHEANAYIREQIKLMAKHINGVIWLLRNWRKVRKV